MISSSKYRVARDYSILCITRVSESGSKSYDILVVFDTLGITIEEVTGITDASVANSYFKQIASKYRGL